MKFAYEFKAELWMFTTSAAPWFLVTVPPKISGEIRMLSDGARNAFSMLKVTARIGKTVWNTSLFYEKKTACFMLPVKAAVRKAERLELDDKVSVALEFAI